MRVGIAGLACLYWPVCIGQGFAARPGVDFVAAATMGEDAGLIADCLGISPERYAADFGIRMYLDAVEMVHAERLDLVALCVPHSRHAALAGELAPLGVDLFVPKTFATTLEDCRRMVSLEREWGIRILSGPGARYLPVMMAVKEALSSGVIGRPFSVRACHHHGVLDPFHPRDWYRRPEEGGPELSLGWYGVDLMIGLLDTEPVRLFASYGNFTTPDSPFMDCGRIEMRMESGVQASFDMYFCNRAPYPSWQLEIAGTGGLLSLHRDPADSRRVVLAADTPEGYRLLEFDESGPDWEMEWLDSLLAGRPYAIDAGCAAELTTTTLAARASAAAWRPAVKDATGVWRIDGCE